MTCHTPHYIGAVSDAQHWQKWYVTMMHVRNTQSWLLLKGVTVSCDNELGNTSMYRLHDDVYACGRYTTKLGISKQAMSHKTQKHTHTR